MVVVESLTLHLLDCDESNISFLGIFGLLKKPQSIKCFIVL